MCFVWISEQTAIISLYNINWLVCITETQCVYCEVRAESLCIIQVSFDAVFLSFSTCHLIPELPPPNATQFTVAIPNLLSTPITIPLHYCNPKLSLFPLPHTQHPSLSHHTNQILTSQRSVLFPVWFIEKEKWAQICTKNIIRVDGQIKKNEMGGAFSTFGGEKRCIHDFGGEIWGKEITWETKL